MKVPYQNELYELRKWIDNTNANLSLQLQFFRTQQEIQIVKHCRGNTGRISILCFHIAPDCKYPLSSQQHGNSYFESGRIW